MDNQCFRTDNRAVEWDTAHRAKSMKLHAPSAATKEPFHSSLWMASRYSAAIASAKSAQRAAEDTVAEAVGSNASNQNRPARVCFDFSLFVL